MQKFIPRFQCKNLIEQLFDLASEHHFNANLVDAYSRNQMKLQAIDDFAMIGVGFQMVNLPNSVTAIGEGAFARNQLNRFDAPAHLQRIDNRAFWYNHIRSIDFNSGMQVADNAFDHQEIAYSDFDLYGKLHSFKPDELISIYVDHKLLGPDDVRAEIDSSMIDFDCIQSGRWGVPSFRVVDDGRLIKPIHGVNMGDSGFLKIAGYFNLKILPLDLTIHHVYLSV